MSAFRVTGPDVRLQERFTVTSAVPWLTLATTNRGPIVKSGCGREARKTWQRAGAGAASAAQTTAARATHDLIMGRSSAKVRLLRGPDYHERNAPRRQRNALRESPRDARRRRDPGRAPRLCVLFPARDVGLRRYGVDG